MDTLYESIGGRATVLKAVNAFYQKVLADKSLAPFFKGTHMEHLQARQSMFLTMLLGGRVEDASDHIHESHKASRASGLNDSHFNTFLAHFRAALEEAGVASDALERIMQLLEGSRRAVLGR